MIRIEKYKYENDNFCIELTFKDSSFRSDDNVGKSLIWDFSMLVKDNLLYTNKMLYKTFKDITEFLKEDLK